jgi:ADP-heptose:LPS heptosyltransferase
MIIKKIKHYNRQKNQYFRELKLRLACLLLDRKNTQNFDASSIKKVLILRDDNKIGDMVVSTGLFRQLHDNGVHVSVVCGKSNFCIIENNPIVDQVFFFEKGVMNTIKLALRLRREKFDLIFDFGDYISPIYFIFVSLIHSRHVIGFNKSKFNVYDVNYDYPHLEKHITGRYKEVLSLFSLNTENYQYSLAIPQSIEDEVNAFLESLAVKKLVVINPFTANKSRDLSIEQIDGIVKGIKKIDESITIIIIGTQASLKEIAISGVEKSPFATFMHAAALVKDADLVISPDTSWVHVACAYQRPLIALYGNSEILGGFVNNKVWAPNYSQATQIISQDSAVSSIPVERITQEIERNLAL